MAFDPTEQQPVLMKDHKRLSDIVYYSLFIVAVGFLGIVLNYLAQSGAALQSLSNEVHEQGSKIDTLTALNLQVIRDMKQPIQILRPTSEE